VVCVACQCVKGMSVFRVCVKCMPVFRVCVQGMPVYASAHRDTPT